MTMSDEQSRIAQVYAERARRLPAGYYSPFHPGNLFISQGRERAMLRLLAKAGCADLSELRILDLGCGFGGDLRHMLDLGAQPENLFGVDLLPERLERARQLAPQLNFQLADAQQLPFPDASFDLVMQATAFSSIVDPDVRRQVAREIARVLRPGGLVLWYDMRLTNPRNPNLVPMTAAEIADLFPDFDRRLESVTLFPPLSRRLARLSWSLCTLLETLPFLRSHLIGTFRKPGRSEERPA
jgi:SAM-dependent methyltransferase